MLLLRKLVGLEAAGVFLLFLSLVGCPISWHKNALGSQNLWLGYQVHMKKGTARLPKEKLAEAPADAGKATIGRAPHEATGDVPAWPSPMGGKSFFSTLSPHLHPASEAPTKATPRTVGTSTINRETFSAGLDLFYWAPSWTFSCSTDVGFFFATPENLGWPYF